jgi:hypothetical protein
VVAVWIMSTDAYNKFPDGFGLLPLKAEGMAAHPDGYGIGWGNGYRFPTDKQYLEQLQAYADWHGVEATKQEQCERPHLLEKLVERKKRSEITHRAPWPAKTLKGN